MDGIITFPHSETPAVTNSTINRAGHLAPR